ncbi:MAG: hypothetical protein GY820_15975 [Gammaproteobacteria bacterium]|nr:hypothetical protein [Gammaproteobacteria bacterium]
MRYRIRPKRQIMRQDAANFPELCGNYAANFSKICGSYAANFSMLCGKLIFSLLS